MGTTLLDIAVVGAGFAGLSVSYHLRKHNIHHQVFERGRIAETWRSQRWDTFVMNTPNKYNVIPPGSDPGLPSDGFGTATEFYSYLAHCCDKYQLPVKENATVLSITKEGDQFNLDVRENGSVNHYKSKQVIIASGCMNEKKIPAFARNIDPAIVQLHTVDYRSAAQLPAGNVLVTGSAQSGCQVAEDLADAGRTVYLSTSKVGRFPRRYRGRDIVDWMMLTGFLDVKTEEVTDPAMFTSKVPVVSGVGPLGHTISYQLLASRGVTILGRMYDANSQCVFLEPNAGENVKFGDDFSQKIKDMVDDYISANRVDAPPPEADPGDAPDPGSTCANPITTLNLSEHNISSIIWTTGFGGDFNYLEMDVLDADGLPKHKHGISDVEGLYYLGLPWLRARKSANLIGINDDVKFIADIVRSKLS